MTIALNWLGFVYGVNTGQVVQTSLGYFINPLVSVLLGVSPGRLRGVGHRVEVGHAAMAEIVSIGSPRTSAPITR